MRCVLVVSIHQSVLADYITDDRFELCVIQALDECLERVGPSTIFRNLEHPIHVFNAVTEAYQVRIVLLTYFVL